MFQKKTKTIKLNCKWKLKLKIYRMYLSNNDFKVGKFHGLYCLVTFWDPGVPGKPMAQTQGPKWSQDLPQEPLGPTEDYL